MDITLRLVRRRDATTYQVTDQVMHHVTSSYDVMNHVMLEQRNDHFQQQHYIISSPENIIV